MIDLGRAFKAPFDDKDWLSKTALGLLWGLLVVTAPAVSGAQLEYIRGVSRGDERLPDWNDFGTKWVEGFMVILAGILYFLPVFVIGALFVVPVATTVALGGGSDSGQLLGGLFAGGFCLYWILAIVYSVAVSVLFSAAMTNYAMKRSFGAFFEFGGIMALVRGGTGYFTAWIYTVLIAFVGSALASVLAYTIVGGILSTGVTYLIAIMSGHVLGQWAAQAFGTSQPTASTSLYPAPQPPTPTAPAAYIPAPPAPPIPPAADAEPEADQEPEAQ